MTVSADAGLFDPRSYSSWLAAVLVVATVLLMLSLRKKAKTKDYLRSDSAGTAARRLMNTAVRKNVFAYRGGAFGAGARSGRPPHRGLRGLYARLFAKTRL